MKNDDTLRVRMPRLLKRDIASVAYYNGVTTGEMAREIPTDWVTRKTGRRYEPPGLDDMQIPPQDDRPKH